MLSSLANALVSVGAVWTKTLVSRVGRPEVKSSLFLLWLSEPLGGSDELPRSKPPPPVWEEAQSNRAAAEAR